MKAPPPATYGIPEGKQKPHLALVGNKIDLEYMRTVKSDKHNNFAQVLFCGENKLRIDVYLRPIALLRKKETSVPQGYDIDAFSSPGLLRTKFAYCRYFSQFSVDTKFACFPLCILVAFNKRKHL